MISMPIWGTAWLELRQHRGHFEGAEKAVCDGDMSPETGVAEDFGGVDQLVLQIWFAIVDTVDWRTAIDWADRCFEQFHGGTRVARECMQTGPAPGAGGEGRLLRFVN